jgi:CRISPR-associated protein (TIGR03986 family)
MVVTAPFQFARIPRAVWFPEWGPLVSHDVPFADGYSGTIDIEIEAMTPLLIGGERRGATATKEGEVWPVQLPDGTYAIPGSSLQGMIRNILEIACFGKLGPWVDKRRFGIRDISGSATGVAAYSSRMNHRKVDTGSIIPDVKAGWLRRDGDKFYLMRCEMARIDYQTLEPLTNASLDAPPAQPADRHDNAAMKRFKKDYKAAATWKKKSDVTERYDWLKSTNIHFTLSPKKSHGHRGDSITIQYDLVDRAENEAFEECKSGRIILTGNASDPPRDARDPHKHMEFIFYDEQDEFELGEDFEDRFKEFEQIHEPNDGRPKNPNWAYYRDTGYQGTNGWMPIFYLADAIDDSKIESFGLAFMFKLAHKNDTHDMLQNSSATHVDKKTHYELASLIFGGVGSERDGSFGYSLKRRASFDWAPATLPSGKGIETGKANDQPRHAILLGPKPSYYPIYVRQPDQLNKLYATHTPAKRRRNDDGHSHTDTNDQAIARNWPELSGAKIWPNAGRSLFTNMPELPANADRNQSVQNKLNALPIGTTFKTTLHVHNLRKAELSALIWALTFGDEDAISANVKQFGKCHHRIGMGKPLGLGELKMAIRTVALETNAEPSTAITLEDIKPLISDDGFAEYMDKICEKLATDSDPPQMWKWHGAVVADGSKTPTWSKTSQVNALLVAAEPNGAQTLGYMSLGKTDAAGSYVGERAKENFLTPFSDGWELTAIHDPAKIEFAAPLPERHNARHQNHDGNRDQNRGQNPPRHSPQTARIYRAEVGCPVKHDDGRIGEISKIEHGLNHIRTEGDEVEIWPANSFKVTGPPDL